MNNKILKQVLIGVGGMILTAAITGFALKLLGDHYKWISYLLLAVFAALFPGFIGYIFGGKRILLKVLPFGFCFVAVMAGMAEISSEYRKIFLLALAIGITVFIIVKRSKKDKREITGTTDKTDEKEIDFTELSKGNAITLFRRKYGYFQMIKGADRYFMKKIGSELSGINPKLVVHDFTDESSLQALDEKDSNIKKADILSIKHSVNPENGTQYQSYGSISVVLQEGEKHFLVLDEMNAEELEAFFDGITVNRENTDDNQDKKTKIEEDTEKVTRIIMLNNAVALISTLVAAIFYFDLISYKIASLLCILMPLTALYLYLRYKEILSMNEGADNNSKTRRGKINIFLPLLIPTAVLLLRSLTDINIVAYTAFALCAAVPCVLILFLFFKFSDEYRKYKSVIALILVFTVVYSASSVAQLNYILDYNTPQTVVSKVSGMRTKNSTYYITVVLSDGSTAEIKVAANVYNNAQNGGTISITEHKGLLGIKYVNTD